MGLQGNVSVLIYGLNDFSCHHVSFVGSNEQEYMFLLKGHEDLRQDERVMQLFGLVNTLLAADTETFKRHLG